MSHMIWIGMAMYKSILMYLEVFPIFISSPPNLILKIFDLDHVSKITFLVKISRKSAF